MKLVGTKTSPYVRKARVILAERRLPFEFIEESAWTADTKVPRYNPLIKVPALVLDDGESIYDSRVICEYLDAVSGGGLIPSDPAARARVRRDEALGDGIADAGITAFLERKREAARQDPTWIARQLDKVNAGIVAVAKGMGSKQYLGGTQLNMGDIACACALFWAEFRMPELRWREAHPNLKDWAERMESRPSFESTRPG
ncbi:MAG TPA: glutathione S-transferase N-terminal domain-containing protein [Usitatibacter sp.]|jgi:glutathione S-transferase|nr:glutathione S-transferase N-terminal domain-containing protein [Usitatibacter sp.]